MDEQQNLIDNADITAFVLVPGASVESMEDDIADGSVADAETAAYDALARFAPEFREYKKDFSGSAALLSEIIKPNCVFVVAIVTNLQADGFEGAWDHIASLRNTFVVIVAASDEGFDELRASKLGELLNVDVVSTEDLEDETSAFALLNPWLKSRSTQ